MDNRSVLLICNESNTVINFRKELILLLLNKGLQITVIIGDDFRKKEIESLGVDVHVFKFRNRDINPFRVLSLKHKFTKFIKNLAPDLVFTFQAKPNIVGAKSAKKAHVKKIFSMVEGLGDPFQAKTFKQKIISKIVKTMYKSAFKKVDLVYFLNNDDKQEFLSKKIINEDKCVVLPGIGIDTKQYQYDGSLPKNKDVIIISRLIANKGIIDCCNVAKIVKTKRPDINFKLFGEESELTKDDIKEYIYYGYVDYRGFSKKISEEITNSRILLSCSYREGFPRVILEAMALGRITIGSDVIGNRDAIVDGQTGFLVEIHNVEAFAEKILSVIDDDSKLLEMGKNCRNICESKYDAEAINNLIYNNFNL